MSSTKTEPQETPGGISSIETQETPPCSPTSEMQAMSVISPPSPTNDAQESSEIIPCQTMRDHDEWVRGVVHLPGGQRAITCSNDGSLRQWDLENGMQIGKDWRDQEDGVGVITIALSPNSKIIASGSGDGTVRLWDVETEKVIARWNGHTRSVWSVCWSPDGEQVVSGSHDGTARVWDVESGKTILGPMKTGHRYVYAVIYSPDTTKIGTGGYKENAVQIWDAKTGELLSTIEHNRPVYSMSWTSDGKKLIVGSDIGSIRIFDTATLSQIAILERHHNAVLAISLSRSDRLLASASRDRSVRLWNLDTNLPIGPPLRHEAGVFCAAISPDGKLLVTGCNDYNAYVWDIHAILREFGAEYILSIPDAPPKDEPGAADKSPLEADATRDPDQLEDEHQLPQGFFDNLQDTAYSSRTHSHPHPSVRHRSSTVASFRLRPRAALVRLSSLFRSHPNTQDATQLQKHSKQGFLPRFSPRHHGRHRPPLVKVAYAQDRQSLFVAPQSKKKTKIQLAQAQEQQEARSQPEASSSRPQATVAAETPATSMAFATTPPSHPGVVADHPKWLIRILYFICCVSANHAVGQR